MSRRQVLTMASFLTRLVSKPNTATIQSRKLFTSLNRSIMTRYKPIIVNPTPLSKRNIALFPSHNRRMSQRYEPIPSFASMKAKSSLRFRRHLSTEIGGSNKPPVSTAPSSQAGQTGVVTALEQYYIDEAKRIALAKKNSTWHGRHPRLSKTLLFLRKWIKRIILLSPLCILGYYLVDIKPRPTLGHILGDLLYIVEYDDELYDIPQSQYINAFFTYLGHHYTTARFDGSYTLQWWVLSKMTVLAVMALFSHYSFTYDAYNVLIPQVEQDIAILEYIIKNYTHLFCTLNHWEPDPTSPLSTEEQIAVLSKSIKLGTAQREPESLYYNEPYVNIIDPQSARIVLKELKDLHFKVKYSLFRCTPAPPSIYYLVDDFVEIANKISSCNLDDWSLMTPEESSKLLSDSREDIMRYILCDINVSMELCDNLMAIHSLSLRLRNSSGISPFIQQKDTIDMIEYVQDPDLTIHDMYPHLLSHSQQAEEMLRDQGHLSEAYHQATSRQEQLRMISDNLQNPSFFTESSINKGDDDNNQTSRNRSSDDKDNDDDNGDDTQYLPDDIDKYHAITTTVPPSPELKEYIDRKTISILRDFDQVRDHLLSIQNTFLTPVKRPNYNPIYLEQI